MDCTPLVIEGLKFPIKVISHTRIKIGCKSHTVAEWKRLGSKLAKSENVSKDELSDLRYHFNGTVKWMKTHNF